MELVEQKRAREVELYLRWIPRDDNAEADALTNWDFSGFTMENRVLVEWPKLQWMVLESMMDEAQQLYDDIQASRTGPLRRVTLKRQGRKNVDPW